MWCCGCQILGGNGKYRKSVFDKKQIEALKRKFNNVSGNQQFITRETFKKNIGYLGIRAVSSFLERIFNSFDIDQDNKISFDDFIEYMEILKDGTDDQKAMISFNLIYMEPPPQIQTEDKKRKRKKSQSKSNQGTFHLYNNFKPTKKMVDLPMFQRFFQQFYKSWSSITNQSIPTQTKNALKKFISQLFKKVQADGRKAIDLDYYKMLYKDRQFMMAFRQINSKLGNFFIKTTNNQFQKNVALIHKIFKKINGMFDKTFPLMNKAFLQQSTHQTTASKIKEQYQSPLQMKKSQSAHIIDQNLDKYYFDAQRYMTDNIFQGQDKFQKSQNYDKNSQDVNPNIERPKVRQTGIQNHIRQNLTGHSTQGHTIYQNRLQDHVVFLQRKLLFLQNCLKQIIQQSKKMYNQMHQQFLKILQRMQIQQRMKQAEINDYNRQHPHKRQERKTAKSKQKRSCTGSRSKKQSHQNKIDKKVFFGDKNFNLVLQIMVGIQMSVRSVSGFQQIIFEEPEDFNLKHTFQMDYGHFGQNDILYTFTDYAPNVFNHIRKIYEIDNQHYISSIGPNKMMSSLIMGRMASFEQLMSEGKSGSFFYHTEDGKYLIKTITQKQFYFMRKILQKYFRHVKTNPRTLMPRFFGLHKITSTMKKQISANNKNAYYLIVMNNFFNTNDIITDKYDLKGSWIGRQNTSGQGVKKDINFIKQKKLINIEMQKKVRIYQIIEKDAQFFSNNNIIDYSMLVGFVQSIQQKKSKFSRANSLYDLDNQFFFQSQVKRQKNVHFLEQKKSMNFKFQSQSKMSQFYLIGIIDILTEYNSVKQAQHLFKSCIYDSKGISAVPPIQYKDRFLKFIKQEVFRMGKKERSKQKYKNQQKQKQKKNIENRSDQMKKCVSQYQQLQKIQTSYEKFRKRK